MTPTQKKSSNYGRIRTTAELDKAIRSVHAQRSRLGKGLSRDANSLWKRYQPSNLMNTAIKQVTPSLSWVSLGLGLVRSAKRLVSTKPKPQTHPAADGDLREA